MSAIYDLPQDKVNSLGELAKQAKELEHHIENLQQQLSEAQAAQKDILEFKMPEIMMEIGIDEIKLNTGEKLTKKPYYSASIHETNQLMAFKWLRDNGHESLIKNEVKGAFGKGEDELARKVMETLEKVAPNIFTSKTSVHPMTLKSFVKEQIESGNPFPQELFGVFIGQKVTIK